MAIPFDLYLAGAGGIFAVLGIPMWARFVPPNPIYGLRVASTDADVWVWYEANAACGRDLVVAGGVEMLLALALPGMLHLPATTWEAVRSGVVLVPLMFVAIVGNWRANRLLRKRDHLREIERQIVVRELEAPGPPDLLRP